MNTPTGSKISDHDWGNNTGDRVVDHHPARSRRSKIQPHKVEGSKIVDRTDFSSTATGFGLSRGGSRLLLRS